MMKLLLIPLSWLYALAVTLRHKLFDWGIFKSKEYDIPIICIGNLTVGGTGKTPATEFLIRNLASSYNIAILSRGYGRTSKGFVEVETSSSYRMVGDEPKQIKRKFPKITVAVCEKRSEGIEKILMLYPETNLIILDDGFQHRWVEPWVNIVLMDHSRPIHTDHFLPYGSLRDSVKQLHRANVIIVTKCPSELNSLQRRLIGKHIDMYPYQRLFFSNVAQLSPEPVFKDQAPEGFSPTASVIVMAGIANAEPFTERIASKHTIYDKLIFGDHHPYRKRDMATLSQMLSSAPEGTVIITTEKDAIKLTNSQQVPLNVQKALYFIPIEMKIMNDQTEELLNTINKYVKSNQKYSLQH